MRVRVISKCVVKSKRLRSVMYARKKIEGNVAEKLVRSVTFFCFDSPWKKMHLDS